MDHLENTKGFSLRSLRYLVMDEADRILNMDFETEVRRRERVKGRWELRGGSYGKAGVKGRRGGVKGRMGRC